MIDKIKFHLDENANKAIANDLKLIYNKVRFISMLGDLKYGNFAY